MSDDNRGTLAEALAVVDSEIQWAHELIVSEVARLTEERDQYAAVIAAAIDTENHMADQSFYQIVGKMVAILEGADPAATLAVRDAEKKAEGWDEGFDAGERDVMEHNKAGWAVEKPCIPNPYRTTTQQQGYGETMLSRIATASEQLSNGGSPAQQGEPQ
jgi:hypothetical protein